MKMNKVVYALNMPLISLFMPLMTKKFIIIQIIKFLKQYAFQSIHS